MKKKIALTLATLILAGGLSSCSSANNDPAPAPSARQAQNSDPSATSSPGEDPKDVEHRIKDSAVQTDLQFIAADLKKYQDENSGEGNFREEAIKIIQKYKNEKANAGTELAFDGSDDGSYYIKGWNVDGWQYTSKEKALVFDSVKGFTNAWAASK